MANRFWVGGTDNWNGTAGTKWSTTSGGAGGAAEPTSSDDVFFDGNSGINTITVVTSTRSCNSLNFTGFTGTFTGSGNLTISGSITLVSGMVCSYSGVPTFNSTSSQTITSAGQTFGNSTMTFNGSGGSWALQDNLDATNQAVVLTAGTINLNSFTFKIQRLTSSNTNTRGITFAGGIIEIETTAANIVWDMLTPTNSTINTTGGGLIKLVVSSSNRRFDGGGNGYPNFWTLGGTGTLTFTGSNTFSDFKDTSTVAHTIIFTTGTTTTVSTWNVNGTAGNLITINSSTTGTHSLVKSSVGIISSDYLNIQHSVATPSSTWYAGTNSINNQAVVTAGSGWIFTVPPTSGNFLELL